MLSPKYKITKPNDFKRIEKEGKMNQYPLFGIVVLKRSDKENSRFGFIISTKISKDSVDRNRMKRAISESIRLAIDKESVSYDVLFLAKPILTTKSTEEIMRSTKAALTELGIIK